MSALPQVTKRLSQRWTCTVLLVTASLVLSFILSFEHQRDKMTPSGNVKQTIELSRSAPSHDEATKAEVLGACNLDRKFMPEGSMPLILLLSFPGSGNTWVRFLIERSTGIYSGSRFNAVGTGNNDTSIWRESNPCLKQTVIVKSHEWKDFDNPQGERCEPQGAILLIRNPYGAILAEFNRQKSGKTGTALRSEFKGQEWRKFAKSYAIKWSESIRTELQMIEHLLIVFYENLVKDTKHELQRMLEFLQVAQNKTRIACLLQDTTGNFKRIHKNFSFNPFSADINKTIDQNIRRLRKFMTIRYNYTLPLYESCREELQ